MSKWSSAFRDSRWQKKRLEIMNRDKWTCRSCGKSGENVTLNVHHAYYETGKAPWEYLNETLVTLCDKCHKERHDLIRVIDVYASNMPFKSLVGLVHASMMYQKSLSVITTSFCNSVTDENLKKILEVKNV